MQASLWVSKTGLAAQDAKMAVISNNLANVNTVGFKRDRVAFEDLFYHVERQPGVQLTVGGVQLVGPVEADDADGPIGLDLDRRREVVAGEVAHEVGSPRMRVATRLRWICDVPPMTLCARLYR